MNHTPFKTCRAAVAVLAGISMLLVASAASAQMILVGLDDQAQLVQGKLTIDPDAKRTVAILAMGGYGTSVKAILDIPNSIFGPPTNLQITPDDSLGLVATAVELSGNPPKFVPSDDLHVIDLEANPPKVIQTFKVGRQPSGMSIRSDGKLVLIANRGETSVSVLSIDGKAVKMLGKVDVGEQPSHVVFTPDGKRAVVNLASTNQVGILAIDGMKVTDTGIRIPVGIYPYNSDITPDGKLALVGNTGNNGRSDGNLNTISVIDLTAPTPHVIDTIPTGDAPEGIAISPKGDVAVTGNLCGSDAAPDAWWYHKTGCIDVYAIDGKKVTHVDRIDVGGVSEALAFSADGGTLFVGNLLDQDISVFRVSGSQVTNTMHNIKVPGHPGAMRGRAR